MRQERETDELHRRVHQLEDERIADHEEMAELRAEMAEWRRGMALVFDQMKAAEWLRYMATARSAAATGAEWAVRAAGSAHCGAVQHR
jgi:hypothetical protein